MPARQSVNNSPILGVWNIFAVLLIAVSLVATDLLTQDEIAEAMANVPKFFCGQKINQLMANYCNPEIRRVIEGGRNKKSSPLLTKLDFNSFDVDQAASFNYDEEISNDALIMDEYLSNLPRLMVFFANARRRRGITDECCRKPCTLRQLVAFCPEGYRPKLGKR